MSRNMSADLAFDAEKLETRLLHIRSMTRQECHAPTLHGAERSVRPNLLDVVVIPPWSPLTISSGWKKDADL